MAIDPLPGEFADHLANGGADEVAAFARGDEWTGAQSLDDFKVIHGSDEGPGGEVHVTRRQSRSVR